MDLPRVNSHSTTPNPWASSVVAVAIVLAAALGRWLLNPLLGNTVPYITFFPAVVMAAWYGGFRPAVLATLLAGLTAWVLFIPPRFSLGIQNTADLIGLVVFLTMGLAIASFGGGMRAAQRREAEAEQAARRNTERLRTTLASIGDAVIATDERGHVTYLNPVAEALTGWTSAEATSLPLERVFHIVNETSRQLVENPATRALREGTVVGLANHTVLIAKDGVERPIDDSAAPIRDELGRVHGCVLIFRDVTQQRQASRVLQASERRRSAMFETALDCIISMDHTGAIVEFNAAAEQTFGYRRDEVLGRDLASVIIPPKFRDSHRQGLAHYLATGEGPVLNRRLELSALHSSGREFSVELTVTRVPVDGPPQFTAYLRDIDERKRAEAAKFESDAFSQGIFESSPDCVKVLDPEGRLLKMNANGLCVMEIDDFSLLEGRPWVEMWPEEERDEVRAALNSARIGGNSRFQRPCPTAKGKYKWWDVVVAPLHGRSGDLLGFVSVSRDITDRRDAEVRLQKLATDLSEADRRKDEFLAMLAHELRNPLAPIRNALQIMRLDNTMSEPVDSACRMMERQVGQMVRLVDDLLDVSRITRGKIELKKGRVELASSINHAVEAVQPLVESMDHDLEVVLPTKPIYVDADPTRLAQIVGNLLTNACKFTDRGGKIRLSVDEGGDEAVISVRDNGIGIPADRLPQIFEMFMQIDTSLERTVSGLGIGLTLVKKLVTLHGGTIDVQSGGANQGSEFIVRLPTVRQLDPPSPAKAPPSAVAPRRILVVDDNRDSASSLAMLLRRVGHTTHVAYDGAEALEAFAAFGPNVVLLDIGLPRLNGYEVARKLRESGATHELLLVALTGWGQDGDRHKSREAGFDGHLVKPVDFAALNQLLLDKLGNTSA